jgi:NADPH-dependent glutamate synthase beta subunit-like oxidoreductase
MRPFRVEIPTARYFEKLVRCREACPILTDAGGYVRAIAQGDDAEAFRIAALPNPLVSICGRICAHPCEEACNRGRVDEPVSIRALKRFVTERFGVESPGRGHRGLASSPVPAPAPGAPKVAVVGAGPAGLACAHDLAHLGYHVTLLEASPVGGGMIRLGIPEYRLPRDLIRAEVDAILGLGVEMRTGWRLGTDFSIHDLMESGYRAVFLAIGAFRGRDMRVPGVEQDGIVNGIDFLINVNLGYHVELGARVAVIGGGNVAMDVARAALRETGVEQPLEDGSTLIDVARAAVRLGSSEVHVYALESRSEMPAFHYEVAEAEEEGIVIHPSRGPQRFLGDGRVTGVEFLQVASVFDPDGRFNPRFVPGSEETVPADTVLLAIGQSIDASAFARDPEITLTPRGTVSVDRETLETSVPGVFAGGDAAFGARNIISAIAEGRRAARSIHRLVAREEEAPRSFGMRPVPLRRDREPYEKTPRVPLPTLPLVKRVGFREVEEAYTEAQARCEADRCLWCHVHPVFDSERCVLCGGCADVCPVSCLRLVPASALELPADMLGSLARGLGSENPATPMTAILMESEKCIRCGLCALRCPTDAITMQEIRWTERAC